MEKKIHFSNLFYPIFPYMSVEKNSHYPSHTSSIWSFNYPSLNYILLWFVNPRNINTNHLHGSRKWCDAISNIPLPFWNPELHWRVDLTLLLRIILHNISRWQKEQWNWRLIRRMKRHLLNIGSGLAWAWGPSPLFGQWFGSGWVGCMLIYCIYIGNKPSESWLNHI